jgi:hypothetical protein
MHKFQLETVDGKPLGRRARTTGLARRVDHLPDAEPAHRERDGETVLVVDEIR